MSTSLVKQISDQLGISEDDAAKALGSLASSLDRLAESGGTLSVPGLGMFEGSEGVLTFVPTSEVADAVNQRYSQLETLRVDGDGESVSVIPPGAVQATTELVDDVSEELQPEVLGDEFVEEPDDELEAELEAAAVDSEDVELDAAVDDVHEAEVFAPPVFAGADDESDLEEAEHAASEHADTWPDETHEEAIGVTSEHADTFDETEDQMEDQAEESAEQESEPATTEAASGERKGRAPLPSERKLHPTARLFVPLLGVLVIIFGTLWAINRDWGSGTDETPGDSATGQTEETSGGQTEGAEGGEAGEGTAGETAEVEPVVDWQSGSFDLRRGGYTIVVSSEPSRAAAEAIASAMASRLDLPVDVLQSTVNNETRYRVGVGQFTGLPQAQRQLRAIADELPEGSWVLPLTADM